MKKKIFEYRINTCFKQLTFFALLGIMLIFLFTSCAEADSNKKKNKSTKTKHITTAKTIKIGISRQYGNYCDWLNSVNDQVECIDLYSIPRDSALKLLDSCDGLLLSGGPDVEPSRYGKGWDSARCEIDYVRDTLEFELIKKASKIKIPILGICRGEQILNVAYGGTLIVDIPEDIGNEVAHKCKKRDTCLHYIRIDTMSLSSKICKEKEGVVNSHHHQAVDKLADCFVATAYSLDGIVEAFEWKDKTNKPFLLAVQWHPERMNVNMSLSLPIAEYFISNVIEFKNRKNDSLNK